MKTLNEQKRQRDLLLIQKDACFPVWQTCEIPGFTGAFLGPGGEVIGPKFWLWALT